MSFDDFFAKVTTPPGKGARVPYDYQRRLAGGDIGCRCESLLIDVPTGLGKTAAVVLAWLWNRVAHPDPAHRASWPRRLVYCLPMRTLVEQTHENIRMWLENLDKCEFQPDTGHAGKIGLHRLMGGEHAGDWDLHPEADAILVGTQDMLLSRALNRGYGMARARWPMHFGLLNNDCLWALDETQLMGVGVRTSAQLQGLREIVGVAAPCITWWASATLDRRLFTTPDHTAIRSALVLGPADLADPGVARRTSALKRVQRLPVSLSADTAKAIDPYLDRLAIHVADLHESQRSGVTLVILNRVNRARGLYERVAGLARKRSLPKPLLVHSRFRPMERAALLGRIQADGERIIISTQAIEAGVDLSARVLVTEIAPSSSLVQRFGRCNRAGEFNNAGGAEIHWIDLVPEDDKAAAGLALPYTPDQLARARGFLGQVGEAGAAPGTLAPLLCDDEPLAESHILRRKDLVELFDTTPDLAGLDIDVGRYIRDGDERDVQVFWRRLPNKPTSGNLDDIVPQHQELVRVAHHEFRKFVEKAQGGAWFFDALEGEWQPARADHVAPGQVYLVDVGFGGYSTELGWTGEKNKDIFPILAVSDQADLSVPRDGQDRDDETRAPTTQSLEEHTAKVVAACGRLVAVLPDARPWRDVLSVAALWHDLGKTHPCFQRFLTVGRKLGPEWDGRYLAKSEWLPGVRHERPHFRHELASALAWLAAGPKTEETTKSLVAYLIATHHGKIRLFLRAMPGEKIPDSPSNGGTPLFARGIWQGDRLLEPGPRHLEIAGIPQSPITLDLTCMNLGQNGDTPSWIARMLALRDSTGLGIFRLAWLETILRAADGEGSRK